MLLTFLFFHQFRAPLFGCFLAFAKAFPSLLHGLFETVLAVNKVIVEIDVAVSRVAVTVTCAAAPAVAAAPAAAAASLPLIVIMLEVTLVLARFGRLERLARIGGVL